jgi:UDP-2,3-diacylglucosamine pyrophosphatase LpxH
VRSLALLAFVIACGHPRSHSSTPASDALAARFPLAKLDDRALCDALHARRAEDHAIVVDPEPRTRRKVIVSDLHLGPGITDPKFSGVEDFYADADWLAFLEREGAKGPTDLIINGDFVEFWQIATVLGALPRPTDPKQPPTGAVLGADQAFATTAIELVIAAHPDVFRGIGRLLDSGDHRVIIIAGNHDADLLWPKVQLAIARAVNARDPSRLVFVDGGAYQHAGTYVAHGHAFDAANRFVTLHAPFGRDRDGRCRLQTNWGEVFVDIFYTETERQIPFIDNLYPERAGALWGLRDNPNLARDVGAALRAIDLLRTAQRKRLNRDAIGSMLQGTFGVPGKTRGPESASEVLDHVADRLTDGDTNAEAYVAAVVDLATDPDLASLLPGLVAAGAALPDVKAALRAIQTIDPAALAKLQQRLFGDPMDTAAKELMKTRGVGVVVLGHTHSVGGFVRRVGTGYYANTGSWISVASVAELRAKGIRWDQLSVLDRNTFPSKMTAIVVEYDGATPRAPTVQNAAR